MPNREFGEKHAAALFADDTKQRRGVRTIRPLGLWRLRHNTGNVWRCREFASERTRIQPALKRMIYGAREVVEL
jgi:hypothetical protein